MLTLVKTLSYRFGNSPRAETFVTGSGAADLNNAALKIIGYSEWRRLSSPSKLVRMRHMNEQRR